MHLSATVGTVGDPVARSKRNNDTTANLGFEAKLWAAADNNMDVAQYGRGA